MLLLSRPLWLDGSEFPRVPFAPRLPSLPAPVGFVGFSVLVVSCGLTAIGRHWRLWFALSFVFFTGFILQDQHRFQPWAYQYMMTGLFLAALPRGDGLRYARWWFVAIYLHSAFSKLDLSFCDGLGLVFLRTAIGPFDIDPATWPRSWRIAAVLLMPICEIAVALMLASPRSRRIGRVGAVGLHTVLIGILGPRGLGHSLIVLLWNATMAAEVWIAFGPGPLSGEGSSTRSKSVVIWPIKGLFWAGVLLPLGERWEAFDAWPSHAYYASHVGRLAVMLHESELDRYPASVLRHVLPGEGPWRAIDLTAWSRSVRGTPVYPGNRAGLGLAEGLTARYRVRLVRVVAYGPAACWTGLRRSTEAVGLEAIRRLGDSYWLNPHAAFVGYPIGPGHDPEMH